MRQTPEAQTYLDWHLKRCARDGTKEPKSRLLWVNAHGEPLSAGHFWERRAGRGSVSGRRGVAVRRR